MPSTCLSSIADDASAYCPTATTPLESVVISPLTAVDLPAVTTLHDVVFGPGRFARTAYRIREGAPALSSACCKLELDGALKGAVQMTWVTVGNAASRGMLLGPLAVCQHFANLGHGQALIAAAVDKAEEQGAGYVILVGDLPYYEKSGFERVPARSIALPGPVDAHRLLIRRLGEASALPSGNLSAIPA